MTQPARGIALWLVLLYTVVTAFLFNIAAVRSLFDPEYQWAAGYFFRTAHGSFRGLEGFLPALVPAVIGFAVWLYGLRGDRRVFGLGVLIWTVFGALNVGLTGELPTFTGGTLGVRIGAVVFGLIIYGAMALAAFWAIVQLRQGLSGLSFAISPPSRVMG